jgi:hypothetical protein
MRERRWRYGWSHCFQAGVLTACITVTGWPPVAAQYVYFTNQTAVQRVDLQSPDVIETLVPDQVWPLAIALDAAAGKVYWTDATIARILRANLDGSDVEPLVTTGIAFPAGLALDLGEGKMYWGDRDLPGVSRANLDGSDPEVIVPGVHSLGVALDLPGGKVYWTEEQARIGRANLDGSDAETVIDDLVSPNAIALDLDEEMLYVTDEGPAKVIRAALDGSGEEPILSGDGINPFGIALDLDEGKVYWSDLATGVSRRSNLDGSDAEDIFLAAWSFGLALGWLEAPPQFLRGDTDSNGRLEITDAVVTLGSLFLGFPAPHCLDAADSDDNGDINITDAVYVLNYLFTGGSAPPPPGPGACGADPTSDALPACPAACGKGG